MVPQTQRVHLRFKDYVGFLLQLHALIAEDRGDSDEADDIRELMDKPWLNLNVIEVERIKGLSADLYSLGAERETPTEKPPEAEVAKYKKHVESSDWDKVLEFVRENEFKLAVHDVAYIRGFSWANLYVPEVAIVFMHESARLSPLKPDQEYFLLTCQIMAGRTEDALPRAQEIARITSSPLLMLKAAQVMSMRAVEIDAQAADTLRRSAIELTECVLEQTKELPSNDFLDVERTTSYLHLAMDYDELGDTQKAIKACEEAYKINPENANVLMMRGWLQSDQRPPSARGDFQRGLNQRLHIPVYSPLPSQSAFVENN